MQWYIECAKEIRSRSDIQPWISSFDWFSGGIEVTGEEGGTMVLEVAETI